MPSVSVVIPTYNRAAYIEQALESALAQTCKDFEVIVVDDGSTDDTQAVLRTYMGSIRYIQQENAGVSAARNAGISAATGEWIAFLDSDDQWRPTKLKRQLACLQRTGMRACFTNSVIFDGEHFLDRPWQRPKGSSSDDLIISDPLAPLLFGSPPLTLPTLLVHRQLLEDVGGFEEAWRIGEDTRLILRILRKTPAVFLDSAEAIINRMPQRAGLYGRGAASFGRQADAQIALLREVYSLNDGLTPAAVVALRTRLSSALLQRAMVACVERDYRGGRRLAGEALRFAGGARTRCRALTTWISPRLVRWVCERQWAESGS